MTQPNKLLQLHYLFLLLLAGAETRHHVALYQFRPPGCVPEPAVIFNGQTLGPTVQAAKGGSIAVNGGLALSAGHNGTVDVPEVSKAEPRVYADHAVHFRRDGAQRSPGLNGKIAEWVLEVHDAGPFAFRREHAVLHYDRRHRSTYEQATGLASVLIMVSVSEPQPVTMDGPRLLRVGDAEIPAGVHPGCFTHVLTIVLRNHDKFEIGQVTQQ